MLFYKNIGGKIEERDERRSRQESYLQTYNHTNTKGDNHATKMRVQVQQLYPAYQRAQVQQLLASNNNNDPKTKEIIDNNKSFWNKQKIGSSNQPSKQQIQLIMKKFSQISVDSVIKDRVEVALLDQIILYLNSCHRKKLIELILKKSLHINIFMPLVSQSQNSSLQFLSLRILKIIADQFLASNQHKEELASILKVLFNQISNNYEQVSNEVIEYLKKALSTNSSYAYYCLTPKIISNISGLLKRQFENSTQKGRNIKSSLNSNRLASLLKICHLTLASSLFYVREFNNIKSIVLNLIQYLLSCPINIQFAIQLILLLKKYSKKGLVLKSEISFIFKHSELIIRILKRYTGQKNEILEIFIFGVSLQKIAEENNMKEDMLYCLQAMINKEQGHMKEACWNILANNTSKSCRQAILNRNSLMNKIFHQLRNDNTKNKVGFSLIINDYIQTASISIQSKRDIVANILKPILELLSSSLSNQLSAIFNFIRKIMKDTSIHVQKCQQLKRMGGIPLLQNIITVFNNNKTIKEDAEDILSEIKLVLNGEVSDISLNMSDN